MPSLPVTSETTLRSSSSFQQQGGYYFRVINYTHELGIGNTDLHGSRRLQPKGHTDKPSQTRRSLTNETYQYGKQQKDELRNYKNSLKSTTVITDDPYQETLPRNDDEIEETKFQMMMYYLQFRNCQKTMSHSAKMDKNNTTIQGNIPLLKQVATIHTEQSNKRRTSPIRTNNQPDELKRI
eukprot:1956716-Amphidinium_carterae.2